MSQLDQWEATIFDLSKLGSFNKLREQVGLPPVFKIDRASINEIGERLDKEPANLWDVPLWEKIVFITTMATLSAFIVLILVGG